MKSSLKVFLLVATSSLTVTAVAGETVNVDLSQIGKVDSTS